MMLVGGFETLQEKPVQILFGECKTSGPIDEEDVRKLGKLVNAIPSDLVDAYILFAKTDTFSREEIELASSLNTKYLRRVILWSREELEPYHVYARSEEKLGEEKYAQSLSDMASVTAKLFFADN